MVPSEARELKAHRVSAHFKHKEFELGETFTVVVICHDPEAAKNVAQEYWAEHCDKWMLQSHLWVWSFPIFEGTVIPNVQTKDLRGTHGHESYREVPTNLFTPNAFRVTQLLGEYIDARERKELDSEEARRTRVESLLEQLPAKYQAELVHEIDLWEAVQAHKEGSSDAK